MSEMQDWLTPYSSAKDCKVGLCDHLQRINSCVNSVSCRFLAMFHFSWMISHRSRRRFTMASPRFSVAASARRFPLVLTVTNIGL